MQHNHGQSHSRREPHPFVAAADRMLGPGQATAQLASRLERKLGISAAEARKRVIAYKRFLALKRHASHRRASAPSHRSRGRAREPRYARPASGVRPPHPPRPERRRGRGGARPPPRGDARRAEEGLPGQLRRGDLGLSRGSAAQAQTRRREARGHAGVTDAAAHDDAVRRQAEHRFRYDAASLPYQADDAPGEIFNAYATRKGVAGTDLRFLFDGSRVRGDQTPAGIGMEEGDQLDCMAEQQGKIMML